MKFKDFETVDKADLAEAICSIGSMVTGLRCYIEEEMGIFPETYREQVWHIMHTLVSKADSDVAKLKELLLEKEVA